MISLLVDASVLLAAFDAEDEHHRPARRLLTQDKIALASLDLARYEVANVAIRAWQAPGSVPPLLAALERLAGDGGVLASTGTLLRRAAELADQHQISIYDAAYVAASEETGGRLVSCDEGDLVSAGLALLPAAASIPT